MDPVAIFQYSPTENPGYFATFLDTHSIPWHLIRIDQGEAVPATPDAFSGLCFLGGVMSVNDDLPWLPDVLALIRLAVERGVPVIGHCLGGQLMARALGGSVGPNASRVIGWWDVTVEDTPAAREWLGDIQRFVAFHWHGETFTIPNGAERLLVGEHCANQAFVIGPHLGMQCHVEMTEEMIRRWNANWASEAADLAKSPRSAQRPDEQLSRMEISLAQMREVAQRLYSHWIVGLRRDTDEPR